MVEPEVTPPPATHPDGNHGHGDHTEPSQVFSLARRELADPAPDRPAPAQPPLPPFEALVGAVLELRMVLLRQGPRGGPFVADARAEPTRFGLHVLADVGPSGFGGPAQLLQELPDAVVPGESVEQPARRQGQGLEQRGAGPVVVPRRGRHLSASRA